MESKSGLDWDGESDSENVFPETTTQAPPNMASNDMSFYDDVLTEAMTSSAGVKRENPSMSRPARGRSYSAIIPGQMPLPRHLSGGRGHGTARSQTASTGSGRSLPGMDAGSPLRHRATCKLYPYLDK